MTTVVATDLDRTLIYSAQATRPHADADPLELIAVERYRDADASFMTAAAARAFAQLDAIVVPSTTRTVEQWRRIRLPGAPAQWVIAANGGVLLEDDTVDPSWTRTVAQRLTGVAALDEVWHHVRTQCRPEWTRALRVAEGLFCYAVLDRPALPAGFVDETIAWAGQRGWQVSLQGRKLYWVPQPLTKSAALAEIRRRTDASTVLAAGDSLLDADLLEAADAGIVARHGELFASGWRAAHVEVTAAQGIRAGEEIVHRLAQLSAASHRDRDRPARPHPDRRAVW